MDPAKELYFALRAALSRSPNVPEDMNWDSMQGKVNHNRCRDFRLTVTLFRLYTFTGDWFSTERFARNSAALRALDWMRSPDGKYWYAP